MKPSEIGPVSTTYFDGRPRVQHMDQAIVDRLVAEAMEKQCTETYRAD